MNPPITSLPYVSTSKAAANRLIDGLEIILRDSKGNGSILRAAFEKHLAEELDSLTADAAAGVLTEAKFLCIEYEHPLLASEMDKLAGLVEGGQIEAARRNREGNYANYSRELFIKDSIYKSYIIDQMHKTERRWQRIAATAILGALGFGIACFMLLHR